MFRLLHISDIHFGPPYVPRVGKALLDIARRLELDLVVASGDFTQRAKAHQFAEAREFLDALPSVPQIVVPGNHDVPLYRVYERVFDPYRYYYQYMSDKLDDVLRFDVAHFVSLNSTAPLQAITNGRISTEQLDFCEAAFTETPETAARIVVAHHPLAPAPDYERRSHMPKSRRALDRFTKLGVEMILGGHLHRAYIGNSLDVCPGGDREHGIIIVQSGTTTSRRGRAREREKNSFNLIEIEQHCFQITHYMYFDDADGFEAISRHEFPRARNKYFSNSYLRNQSNG